MDGNRMRALRDRRGESQGAFAAWLNTILARRYDVAKISRWESGAEKIPEKVAAVLATEINRPTSRTASILTFANQKGGVGKTVSAVNIAYCVAKLGGRVLLIDADSQGNATAHLGLTKDTEAAEDREHTLYYVLRDGAKVGLRDILMPTKFPGFDLAPASVSLSKAETDLSRNPLGIYRLSEEIAKVRGEYDVIVIDSPPHLGAMTISSLTASDVVIIPADPQAFALIGAKLVIETIEQVRSRPNPSLRIGGMLPTKVEPRTKLHQAMLEDMHAHFAPLMPILDVIPKSKAYGEGPVWEAPALHLDPEAPGVDVYMGIARDMLALTKREEISDAAAA